MIGQAARPEPKPRPEDHEPIELPIPSQIPFAELVVHMTVIGKWLVIEYCED